MSYPRSFLMMLMLCRLTFNFGNQRTNNFHNSSQFMNHSFGGGGGGGFHRR